MPPGEVYIGTGRRKSSVARVRVKSGTGQITINERPFEDYFPLLIHRKAVLAPLEKVGMVGKVDIFVRANGGGLTGQAEAIALGIARALKAFDPEGIGRVLRKSGFLTVDSRVCERKKYGLHGARRGTQFSKR